MTQPNYPSLYRKRFIPAENILLKDDIILHLDESTIVTKWDTLKPRKDICRGFSVCFMEKGIKLSKMFSKDNSFFWYIDIIHTKKLPEENSIIFEDLLIDVVIKTDKSVRILDIGEAAEAFQNGIISSEQLIDALKKLDLLLELIHSGDIIQMQTYLESFESAESIANSL